MRQLHVLTMLSLAACGRDELLDEPRADVPPVVETPRTNQAPLVGVYEFGDLVAQGFAGTLGRLATLRVEADGTFTMSYLLGCLGDGASGTWTADQHGARFTFDQQPKWVDATGRALDVSNLRLAPGLGGVVVTGQLQDGVFEQAWAVKP